MTAALRFLRRRPENPEGRMAVLDHLRELRRRLIIAVLFIAVGAVLGWIFYNPILEVLKHPYCEVPYQHRLGGKPGDSYNCKLLFTAPLDGFTSRLKISIIAGSIITSPLWLYQIWGFVTPGLRANERKYTRWFIGVSTLLFAAGVALAYVVLAKGLRYLIEAGGSGTAASITVSTYISFVVIILVTFGAAFELPLLVVMANLAGVLPAKLLRKSQRIAIFLIFVFAAVATPTTDPFTMCAMAVPMVLLYEGAVLYATVHDRHKAARKLSKAAAEPPTPDDQPSEVDPIPRPLDDANPTASSWSDTT